MEFDRQISTFVNREDHFNDYSVDIKEVLLKFLKYWYLFFLIFFSNYPYDSIANNRKTS